MHRKARLRRAWLTRVFRVATIFPGEKRTLSAHHLLSIRFHFYPRNARPSDLLGVGYVMFPEVGDGIIDDVHMEQSCSVGLRGWPDRMKAVERGFFRAIVHERSQLDILRIGKLSFALQVIKTIAQVLRSSELQIGYVRNNPDQFHTELLHMYAKEAASSSTNRPLPKSSCKPWPSGRPPRL